MGLVLALVAVLPASSGHAANCFWQGGTASYNNPANWSCGTVPGTSDNAFNNTGTNNRVQINVGDPDWQVIDFLTGTGVGTSGAFEQNGQTARTTGWFRMGVETGSLGIYTLNGGTLNVFPGRLNLGEKGTGVLNINGGVIYKSGDVIIIGDGAWSGSSTGIVNQSGGVLNTSSELWVGQVQGGVGEYNLSAGQINCSNWLVIARAKSIGKFNMTGGVIYKTSAGPFVVGENTGAQGTLNHSAGTITSDADLWLGQFQSFGTNNLSGTAEQTINSWLVVGRGGGTGRINMTGGTLNKGGPVDRHFILAAGANSVGVIEQTGGVINDTAAGSDLWIGEGDNTTGIWTLSGNATANVGVVKIAYTGIATGVVNLNTGAVFAAVEVLKSSTAGGASGTLNFNGGTLRARANNANFLHDLTAANIQAGGATIDSQGFNIGISQPLSGSGGLTKIGSGTLTLSGANTYGGNTAVSAGTLVVNGSLGSGTVTVASGATLGGSGAIGGPVVVNGTISPGTSVGTLTTGAETWNGGGKYLWEINDADTLGGWDKLNAGANSIDVAADSGNPFTLELKSLSSSSPGPAADFDPDQNYTWQIAAAGSVQNFAATDFTITDAGFVNDLKGGTFAVEADAGGINLKFVRNQAPVATSRNVLRPLGATVKIKVADLLAENTSDPEGDARELVNVGVDTPPSAGTVSVANGFIFYVPTDVNSASSDSFSFKVKDVRAYRSGDTVRTAVGSIQIATVTAVGGQVGPIDTSGGAVTVNFSGIPGYRYDVERSVDLATWEVVDTITAPSNGQFSFQDPNPPQPSAYYRLKYNPPTP